MHLIINYAKGARCIFIVVELDLDGFHQPGRYVM